MFGAVIHITVLKECFQRQENIFVGEHIYTPNYYSHWYLPAGFAYMWILGKWSSSLIPMA